jgi:hypothetical protein
MYAEITRRAKADGIALSGEPNYVAAGFEVVNESIHELQTSPYSQVQFWLSKTHPIAQQTPGDGKLVWAEDDKTMTYLGTSINIDAMGGLFQELTDVVEGIMRRDLLFEVDVPFQLPDVIHDDISVTTRGYSWTKHPLNRDFTSKYEDDFFMKQILLPRADVREKMWGLDGVVTPFARQWMSHIKTFKLNVAILLKLACACAIRDTEVLEMVLEETVTYRRSFYFVRGEMVVVSAYDKMSYLRETVKNIPHSVYKRLAALIAQYHLIIYPFELLLRHSRSEDRATFLKHKETFLADEGGKFDTKLISTRIGELMERKFGAKLTTSDLRHIIQAIIVHCIPPQYMTTGLVNFGLRALNHSEQVGRTHYARNIQSFGTQHPEETAQFLAVSLFVKYLSLSRAKLCLRYRAISTSFLVWDLAISPRRFLSNPISPPR